MIAAIIVYVLLVKYRKSRNSLFRDFVRIFHYFVIIIWIIV
jgi:hypothetical protein